MRGWAHELHQPVPDQAVALAHSLAGSSATVGFTALSEMARLLEHTLQHVQLQPHGLPDQAQVFVATAEDICRLLHQFAAGFLKTPQPQLMDALRDILNTEISSGMAPLEPMAAIYGMDDAVPAGEAIGQGTATVDSSLSALEADRRLDDAIAQAVERGSDLDDDIDVFDVIDPDLFPIFEEEATELFPALGAALRQWAGHPQDMGSRSVVLRALHTLKGSSRLAGAMRLGEMAHRLETAVEQIGTEDLSTDKIEPLLAGLDSLQASFEVLRVVGGQEPEPAVQSYAPEHLAPEPAAVAEAPAAAASQAVPLAAPIRMGVAAQPAAQRSVSGQSVRVRAQLLDRLVNQAGEVLIARSRLDVRMKQVKGSLDDLSGNLERLRQQLRDIEVQAESQMQSRLALSKDSTAGFNPL